LLFWLSLVPFVTGWMGENNFAPAPTAMYGLILLLAAIAYLILQRTIIADQGENSVLAKAVRSDAKGTRCFTLSPSPLRLYTNGYQVGCTFW
jgi:uncharacterized membrane protein